MSTFPRLKDNNDWILGAFATGEDGVLLDVKTAIQEWQRDCWFNMEKGADFYACLQQQGYDAILQQQIKAIVMGREGVTEVTGIDIKLANRALTINISFKTIYGSVLNTQIVN